jgi:hypothetical protein
MNVPNEQVLEDLEMLISDEDVVVCEWIQFYGVSVGREIFDTCRWVGRFEQACVDTLTPFHTILRRDVLTQICGRKKRTDKRSSDSRVHTALLEMLGKEATKMFTGHAWQALATGLAWNSMSMKEGKHERGER